MRHPNMDRGRPCTTVSCAGPSEAYGARCSSARPLGRSAQRTPARLPPRQGPSLRRRRQRGAERQAIGRSRGGRTTKVHLAVDEQGRPRAIEVTPSQLGDARMALALVGALPAPVLCIADAAYDSDGLRAFLIERGTHPDGQRRWDRTYQQLMAWTQTPQSGAVVPAGPCLLQRRIVMRIGIYARVSTQRQAQANGLAQQLERLQAHAL